MVHYTCNWCKHEFKKKKLKKLGNWNVYVLYKVVRKLDVKIGKMITVYDTLQKRLKDNKNAG